MKLHISLLCVSLISLQTARGMKHEPQTDHQQICTAFIKGDASTIEKFIDKATDLNQPIVYQNPDDPQGENLKLTSLLELACQHRMADIIAQLRLRGVCVAQRDEKDDTPLGRTIGRGIHDRETIGFLITQETINHQNATQSSPLHILMYQKKVHTEVLKLLCDQGARIDLKDTAGNTPIHYAVLKDGTGRLLNIMLQNINVESTEEELAFLDIQNKQGATALHLAIERYLESEYTENYLNIIDRLLDLGADLSVKNIDGVSPWELIMNALSYEEDNKRAKTLENHLKKKFSDDNSSSFFDKFLNLFKE